MGRKYQTKRKEDSSDFMTPVRNGVHGALNSVGARKKNFQKDKRRRLLSIEQRKQGRRPKGEYGSIP